MTGPFVFISVMFFLFSVVVVPRGRSRLAVRLGMDETGQLPAGKKERGPLDRLARRAGVDVQALLFFIVLFAVGGASAAFLLTRSPWLSLAGFLLGAYAPRYLAQKQAQKRLSLLEARMDDALNVLSSALRAGASLSQAVASVAEEATGVVREVFDEAERLVNLGVPAAEALAQVAEQTGSQDMKVMAVAAQVQSQAGGNLAEVMDGVAHAIRERRSLRAKLRAQTAQGKMSGKVATALPFMFLVPVLLISPDYMDPLLRSAGGRVFMVVCSLVIFAGWWAVRRITTFQE